MMMEPMSGEKICGFKIKTGIIPLKNHQRNKLALSKLFLLFIFSSCYGVNEHTYLRIVRRCKTDHTTVPGTSDRSR